MKTREEYIETHAKSLLKMCRQRKQLSQRLMKHDQMSDKSWSKLNADYSFLCMEIAKTEERIVYALGYLTLFELRDEYYPSGWHKYEGIKGEVEKLVFKM